jgi:hypothetical protein
MARLKRTSAVVDTARQRLSGLKGITTPITFGPNLTATIYEAKIDAVAAQLNAYNQKIAELDQAQNDLKAAEAELNDLNRRILSAGEAQFGPDSSEYEMLGGTRKSERKKPTKKGGGGSGTGGSSGSGSGGGGTSGSGSGSGTGGSSGTGSSS